MSSSSPTTSSSSASNPNIFTPPPECLDRIFTLTPLGYAIYTTAEDSAVYFVNNANGFNPYCYPEGFGYSLVTEAAGSSSFTQNTLSPATCPIGYTNVAQSGQFGTTTATCCPAYPDIKLNVGYGVVTDLTSQNNWLCIDGGGVTYVNASGSVTSTVSAEDFDGVLIPQIFVEWQDKDLTRFTVPASTSSSSLSSPSSTSIPMTSTPTATQPLPTTTTTPPQPALSTGAKAGIAIGAILGALVVLLLIVGIIWRRRRRNRTGPLPTTDPIEKPELPGEGIEHPQLASKTVYELPPEDKPNEAGSRAAPVEMEGEWAGWEAPALVEVDMSRPFAAARDGGSEQHNRMQQLAKQGRAQG